ncbi:putative membrane protein, partial [Plasmodium reichenowi]
KDYHDEKNGIHYNKNNCDYDNYRFYNLFHFSLKNKKNHNKRYMIKYTSKEEKKTNYIQILLIQKKKKLFVNISNIVDNLIQVKGKINMNILHKQNQDIKKTEEDISTYCNMNETLKCNVISPKNVCNESHIV